ncbi:hypothetical protein WMY93_004749 [Mugilogobius chulae]|uniref:Cationic amino acid transporter C-terminal domain-containing protein n=1 Tax=Mugilogobius chulae TaxID=88201 RepID=A0AAW0Q0P5_9GOBI
MKYSFDAQAFLYCPGNYCLNAFTTVTKLKSFNVSFYTPSSLFLERNIERYVMMASALSPYAAEGGMLSPEARYRQIRPAKMRFSKHHLHLDESALSGTTSFKHLSLSHTVTMASCQRGCAPAVRLCQKLNRLKTLEEDMMATSLKRCLNTLDLTLMGVGGMVGSGLYVLTGTVAKDIAGPAVIVSFIFAGFACFCLLFVMLSLEHAYPRPDLPICLLMCQLESEEAKNPQKAVPIATAVSLGLAAMAYILVSTVLTLIVPWHTLDPNSALSDAFFRRGYSWAGIIVVVGSICAMNTVLLCNLYSLPRIIYAMAEDGLFFSFFARVNPVTKVPVNAILVFGFIMSIIALIFDLQALVQFLSIGTLLAYTFVAASVIVLRFQPEKATVKNSTSPNPIPEPSPARSESQNFKEDCGELKQYESFSDKLQLVERTKVKEQRPTGQLKARWEPYLGRLLGDFEPGEVVAFCVLILLVSSVSLCAVLIFGKQPLNLPVWSFSMLIVIFSLAFVISLVLIFAHEPQKNTKTFQVPLVPLIPGASILVNVFLMMKLSAMTWVRFAVWIGIGIVVYFGYGIWHSKEGKRELQATDMAARYVVLPSGSLVETVQSVQPDGQVEPRPAREHRTCCGRVWREEMMCERSWSKLLSGSVDSCSLAL